ncbi:MAG: hypothetical protein LBI84_09720 [Propionibacteriaceae bacterium]|jgi:hypothetical protein|nr:hypothetical protein [Propionibacteriaceae bacterium]
MRRAATAIAAAALAALSLSGCAQGAAAPSVAAEVGSQVITENEVSDGLDALNAASAASGGTEVTRAAVVNMEIRGALAAEVERSSGVVVEDAEVAAILNELGQALYANPATKDLVVGTIRFEMLQQEGLLPVGEFARVVAATPVTVNPRDGVWDAEQVALVNQAGVLASPLSAS